MEDTVRSQPCTPSTRTKVLSWRNISWTVVSTWKSVPRGLHCQAALSSWSLPGRPFLVVTARPPFPRGHCQAALSSWSLPGRPFLVVTARPPFPRGHCQAALSSWSLPGRSFLVVTARPPFPRGHCRAALSLWSLPSRSFLVVTARSLFPHCPASCSVVQCCSRPGRQLHSHTAPEL